MTPRRFLLIACPQQQCYPLLLQTSAFVVLLALDEHRIQQHRLDLAPCIQLPQHSKTDAAQQAGDSAKRLADGSDPEGAAEASAQCPSSWGVGPGLQWYMREVHAPLLERPAVQGGVLLAFFSLFMLSLAALPHLTKCGC